MPSETLQSIIGTNVMKYRLLARLTQAELAERVGVSTAFISRVEHGQKMMKVQTLLAVSQALNISCDALLHQEEHAAEFENIKKLISSQPPEYLEGIERIIRTCVEEFAPKQRDL